jgi:hypothetical protein
MERQFAIFEGFLPGPWKLAHTFITSTIKLSSVDNIRYQFPRPLLRVVTIHSQKNPAWKIERILGNRKNLESDGRLEFEIKWKEFDNYTYRLIESIKRGEIGALKEFIRAEIKMQEIQKVKKANFSILIDKVI